MLMFREVSVFVGIFFFIGLSCYVIYYGNMFDYLRLVLIDIIKVVSDFIYFSCDYMDYFLKVRKMLEGFVWWSMFKVESMGLNKGFMVVGWVVFIIYNVFSGIVISRLSV